MCLRMVEIVRQFKVPIEQRVGDIGIRTGDGAGLYAKVLFLFSGASQLFLKDRRRRRIPRFVPEPVVRGHHQLSRSCLPASRVSAAVHAGNHDNYAWIDPVIKPVWEPSQQCATSVPMHDLVQHRVSRYVAQLFANGLAELGAQARVLPLVPIERVLQIGRGCRPNQNRDQTPRRVSLARTSSAGRPLGPSRSRSSSLRSSSSS